MTLWQVRDQQDGHYSQDETHYTIDTIDTIDTIEAAPSLHYNLNSRLRKVTEKTGLTVLPSTMPMGIETCMLCCALFLLFALYSSCNYKNVTI